MKKIISVILIVTLSLFVYVAPLADTISDLQNNQLAFDTAIDLISIFSISEKSVAETLKMTLNKLAKEDEEAFYKVMNALASTVDEYSCYYNKEEWTQFSKELSGVICGIGVTAMVVNGYFEVVTLIDGGSAKEAGIMPGDRIIEADGVELTGNKADIASTYITGEEGTMVTIKVLTKAGETITHTLDRRIITVPSVESTIMPDENIGYIVISSFTGETPKEFQNKLEDLKAQNIENIIIDLRNNGGGVMESGINTAAFLMDKGETIISIKGRNDETPEYYTSNFEGYDFNTVILTNSYTASASEIMTCALVENGHAVSIGETTYGKASAQQVFPLVTGGALRITAMYYYTPEGNFINGQGIEPTYEVSNTKYRYTIENAPKLSYSIRLSVGMENDEVEAAETMLYKLGYLTKTPDKVYDEYTQNAVTLFQKSAGLFPYGVCDLTTQSYLLSRFLETDYYNDDQLDFAIKYFKESK